MTKNPIINAAAALLYITGIASFFYLANQILRLKPDNSFLGPIAFMSLFTLSAAVMGYIFLYYPAQLYFENKKKESVNLFLKTVASFAVITLIVLAALFSGFLG